jgi:pilus assembly protein FimV
MRRSRPQAETETPGRRLSDDEALRASMAKTREAGQTIRKEPTKAPAPPPVPVDAELESRLKAVRSRPQDLESHLSLLRLYHARGNAADYELAAQAMRAHVPSTMDPRWREAVVMGASLMPGNSLFGQAGWNSPRFNEPEPRAAAPEPTAVAPAPEPIAAPTPVADPAPAAVKPPATVKVFEFPQEADLGSFGSLREPEPEPEFNLGDEAAVLEETFGGSLRDIHRDEARLQEEDEGSATRIELAKAYLDIGDLDGARSMLEEVLAEGGPNAKAEAARLLKELG